MNYDKLRKQYADNYVEEFGIKCEYCDKNEISEVHEIFYGILRKKSIENNYMACLCRSCHNKMHKDKSIFNIALFNKKYKNKDYHETKKELLK